MKPVEIEFIMRDKLSPGIDKAGKSAETLGDKAEQVSKSITDRIAAQKEQIKYVESCLKDLKKQYDNLAAGEACGDRGLYQSPAGGQEHSLLP